MPEINLSKRWDKKFASFDLKSSLSKWDHISKVDGARADIQIGLDKQWIISRLRGDKLNLSLEGISSMTVSRLQAEDKLSIISEITSFCLSYI